MSRVAGLRNMARRAYRRAAVEVAAKAIGSRRWAEHVSGRWPIEDFRACGSGDRLAFRRLGIEASPGVSELLLRRYDDAVDLRTVCEATFVADGDSLVVTVDGVTASVETPEEILILRELFVDRDYDLSLPAEAVVIDIGMNAGLASLFFARRPDVVCVGYEPFPATFAQAKRNMALNPALAPRIDAINVGLSDIDTTARWQYSDAQRGSCGAYGYPGMEEQRGGRVVTVQLRRATTAISEAAARWPDRPIVAKIDCEGSEYAIVRDLSHSGAISLFSAMMLEWHRRGGHEVAELLTDLASNGFTLLCQGHHSRPRGLLYAVRGRADRPGPPIGERGEGIGAVGS